MIWNGVGCRYHRLSLRTFWRLPRWKARLRQARALGVRWPRRAVLDIVWAIVVLVGVPIGLRRFAGITLGSLPAVQADLGYWVWFSLGLTALMLIIHLAWLFFDRTMVKGEDVG